MTQAASEMAISKQTTANVAGPTVCLSFRDHAEEAVTFYVSLFRNSRILSLVRSDGKGPMPEGAVMHASFELDGREFVAFDGGPTFSFAEGISLMVTCHTQAEIDELWDKLSDGGEAGPCGWLKDRFGVSWQIIPANLGQMLADPVAGNAAKATEAMMKMGKLDIATLERAYRSRS